MADGVASFAEWRDGEGYAYLKRVEKPMFAWEWLRRAEAYRRAWSTMREASDTRRAQAARRFGLVELITPDLPGDAARPIWRSELRPGVIEVKATRGAAPLADYLDIRLLTPFAIVAFGPEDIEHWRIGTEAMSVRLDLLDGTLLDGPTLVRYLLQGLESVRPRLRAIEDLIRLSERRSAPTDRPAATRVERWIAELRTADALAAGASQKEIARVLFGAAIEPRWRQEGESYRLRVQRLVRGARGRLAAPLAPEWFR